MGYWDADLTERRHRQAILARKLAFLNGYGGLTAADADLSGQYDRQLRARHAAFLDAVTPASISWMSPTLSAISTEALIAEIVDRVRNARFATHRTERKGSVATSAGEIYWAIRKPANCRQLIRAIWTRAPFSLALWHSSDIPQDPSLA